ETMVARASVGRAGALRLQRRQRWSLRAPGREQRGAEQEAQSPAHSAFLAQPHVELHPHAEADGAAVRPLARADAELKALDVQLAFHGRSVARLLPGERHLELLLGALQAQHAAGKIAPGRHAPDVLGMELGLRKLGEIEPFRTTDRAVHVAVFHVGARDLDRDVELRALGLVRLEAREARVEFLEYARRRGLLEGGDVLEAARRGIQLPVRGECLRTDQKSQWDDPSGPHAWLHLPGSMRLRMASRLV